MKFPLVALGALMGLAKAEDMIPTQTFFIPMPEKDVFEDTFLKINSGARGPVHTVIAIAISTDDTVVWYDHHEDGYDISGSSTRVWGDGDASNGCAPGTSPCSNESDVLKAGQSIVLQDQLKIDGTSNGIKFDGGDKVLATYPIAITRGEYPDYPGSLMAGAVEVLDTASWGTSYVAPGGSDVSIGSTSAFQHSVLYIMAKDDGTVLTFDDGTNDVFLDAGKSYTKTTVNMGMGLTSNNPVQVDFVTGDIRSVYELRWFSLLPFEKWADDYFSPVGDTAGELKIYLYNPHDADLDVLVTTKDDAAYTVTVPKKASKYTNFIKDGTGAQLTTASSKTFLALSLTDTGGSGQLQDWGFPVLPTSQLTEKVLVGWGYGCTNNECLDNRNARARSVVWVSPCEDATIFVDYDNDGTPDATMDVAKLSSTILTNTEENNDDMSGAVIWAVKQGELADSVLVVPIAAAWGQDGKTTYSWDKSALDLGTLVPPFISVRVDEAVVLIDDIDGDGQISPGDVVEYTIQVQNAGNRDYQAGDYNIRNPAVDANLPYQTYFDETCTFSYNGVEQDCDHTLLDGDNPGLKSLALLPKLGGVHLYKINATVWDPSRLESCDIPNNGILSQPGLGPNLPFNAPEKVHFRPSVSIDKTVYNGVVSDDSCGTSVELVQDIVNTDVTYCFEVTNTGNSYLDDVVVTDANMPDIEIQGSMNGRMAPGEVKWVTFQTKIPDVKTVTNATVTGEPRLVNGEEIETDDGEPVTDQDPAGVEPIASVPQITIDKTVLLDHVSCEDGAPESQSGYTGTEVTYCYEVTNTGLVELDVVVTDPEVDNDPIPPFVLGPGESTFVKKFSTITETTSSPGVAVGTASDGETVEAQDPAGVVLLDSNPAINIEKTVHLGEIPTCSNGQELEYGYAGAEVTYCYEVTNTGDVPLNIVVTDGPVDTEETVTLLGGESTFVKQFSTITETTSSPGVAVGTAPDGETVTDQDPAGVELVDTQECPTPE